MLGRAVPTHPDLLLASEGPSTEDIQPWQEMGKSKIEAGNMHKTNYVF